MIDFDVLPDLPALPDEATITSFDHTTFSSYLPLPFRILFLLVLGFWLCGLNFHYFHYTNISISNLIKYTPLDGDPPLHYSIYRLASVLSVIWSAGILTFWKVTGGSPEDVERWGILAVATGGVMIGAVIWPANVWNFRGRTRFLRMLKRVVVGGVDRDLRFADVLLADVITSYAKTLGDVYILICMSLIQRTHSITARPDRSCGGSFGVPFVMGIPSLIRLRQCLTDYLRTRKRVGRNSPEAKMHLWNAGKYASAFPVILFSAVQREWGGGEPGQQQHILTKDAISHLWLFCVFLNSSYSFYWDVTKDWDLSIFTGGGDGGVGGEGKNHPWGLRPNRHYHSPSLYYGVVVLDFCLRCTWSFKLSPHLGYVNDLEGGIFMLELAELARRWMWIFFRVEKEWVGLGEREREKIYVRAEDGEEGEGERERGEEEGEMMQLEEWRKGEQKGEGLVV